MQHVERLAQELAVDNKRDVGLGGTLGTGNNRDAATSESSEQLTGNTWRVFHVFTHDGDSGQSALGMHWEHGSRLDFLAELLVEHFYGCRGVLVAHTDGG